MNDYYRKYKELKEALKYKEGDIEYVFPLAIDIMSVAHNEKIYLFKIIAFFFSTYDLSLLAKNIASDKILFTDAYERPEYTRLLNSVRLNINNSTHTHFKSKDLLLHLNLKVALSSILFIYRTLSKRLPLKGILFLAARLTFYRNNINVLSELLKTNPIKCKKYVAFNGQYGFESLLTQFFKQKKVQTYTLTHGKTYVSYKKTIPIDIINGENITAETVLTWGEAGKNELVKNFNFSNQRILVAGNPNYPFKNLKIKQSFKNGIILLGRKLYDAGNSDILRIAGQVAKSQNINFSVRMHPSLSYEYYFDLCKQNNLYLTNPKIDLQETFRNGSYDFAIVNNSTTYYESMYHNMICFRYEPDENEEYEGLEDKFWDQDSLITRIRAFKKADNEPLNESITKLLSNNLGMGINKYDEILNS